MKRKRISEALEHLDPAYIDEAAGFTAVRLYQKPLFRLVSVAACLIVCATAVLLSNVFDKKTPPVDTPPVTTTVTGNLTSADTTTTVVTTTATTTTTTTATSITTEPSATVTTSTKKGLVAKGTKTTRTMTTATKQTYHEKETTTKFVTTKPSTTVEDTTITTTTARKGGDLPIPSRGTTTDKDGGTTTCDPSTSVTTKSTSTRPTRPNGSFGETEFRPDVRLQLDKSVYTPDEAITVTIENTSEDTLYLYSLIFWATQTENGAWSNGWGATPLSFTTSVLEPGETCTATKRLSLSPDKTYALALCVGDTWIRSDTFRVMPSSTTTVAEAITTATNAD